MSKQTIPAGEFNVTRYLGTIAYEEKRDKMSRDLNHNNVLFNYVKSNNETVGTNLMQIDRAAFSKTPEEKKELKKIKKKHKKEYGY